MGSRTGVPEPPVAKTALFVIPTLRGGGAERVMITLLRNLDRTSFRPLLAVVDSQGVAYPSELPPDVEIIDLACRRVRYALPRLVKLIRSVRPDVVLSTLGHLNLALAFGRPLLPDGIRFVARETVVVTENLHSFSWPRAWARLYRTLYGVFDCVVCQSHDVRNDLVGRLGLDERKARVIPNPVDAARIRELSRASLAGSPGWTAAPAGLRILAAGRLVHQKGFDRLIRAVAALRDVDPSLVILGEGPDRTALEELARSLGVGERVRFAGFQANPYPHFAASDLFVLSSRYEGMPNVVLESLACGTPVVALPAPGGIRELLEGVPECAIASDASPESLALAIRQWLAGPRRRVPAERIEPYDVARIARLYESVLAPDGHPENGKSGR